MKISLFCWSVETIFNSRTKVSIVHLMLNAISMKTESSASDKNVVFSIVKVVRRYFVYYDNTDCNISM